MKEDEDLGIRSEVPFSQRFDFIISTVSEILGFKIIEYVYVVLLILIVGSRLFS